MSLKGKLGDLFTTHHSLVERCLWDVKSLALWAYPSQGWSSPQDTREPLVGAAKGSRACGGSGQHSGNQPAQVQVSPELVRRLSISNVCFSHYHPDAPSCPSCPPTKAARMGFPKDKPDHIKLLPTTVQLQLLALGAWHSRQRVIWLL